MIVLGYSGLDQAITFAKRNPYIRPGEERIAQELDSAAALLIHEKVIAADAEELLLTQSRKWLTYLSEIRHVSSRVISPEDFSAARTYGQSATWSNLKIFRIRSRRRTLSRTHGATDGT